MKRASFKKYLSIVAFVLLPFNMDLGQKAIISSPVSQPWKGDLFILQFQETGSIFANPGQGWLGSRFPGTIKYVPLDWETLEQERGKYNWAPFDNAISAGKSKGIKISIRKMTCHKVPAGIL